MRLKHSIHLAAASSQLASQPANNLERRPTLHPVKLMSSARRISTPSTTTTHRLGVTGGYFANSGDFSAWTQADGKSAYATGFWWVNDQGGVCLDADGGTAPGSAQEGRMASKKLSCCSHTSWPVSRSVQTEA